MSFSLAVDFLFPLIVALQHTKLNRVNTIIYFPFNFININLLSKLRIFGFFNTINILVTDNPSLVCTKISRASVLSILFIHLAYSTVVMASMRNTRVGCKA